MTARFRVWIHLGFILAMLAVFVPSQGVSAAAPAVTLTPASLDFGNVQVGTRSAPQSVTITNTGDAPLDIYSYYYYWGYEVSFPCYYRTLAPGASCTFTVTFRPTAAGSYNFSNGIGVYDNAPGSPHSVALKGTGVVPPGMPTLSQDRTFMFLGMQEVGTTSAVQVAWLKNLGDMPLTISNIGITGSDAGDFAIAGTNCLPSLAPGASCWIMVRFMPTTTLYRFATVQITDNANGSPHTITVGGTGYTLSAWTSQGGILTDSPAAAEFNGRVYVFAKGSDNALYVKSSANGVDWSGWTNLGGVLTAAPAAAAFRGTLYVFAKGSDNALYVKSSTDGVNFTDWSRLGGILTAPPAAAATYSALYVFAKGSDNALYMKRSTDGVNFGDWQNLGGILTAAPAATGNGNSIYVFAKGSDNALYMKWSYNGVNFSDWRSLGGVLTAAPAATSVWGTMYTLAKGSDNALYERHSVDGFNWTDWRSMGGELKGPPAASSLYGRLYTFAWWRDNTLWERHTLP